MADPLIMIPIVGGSVAAISAVVYLGVKADRARREALRMAAQMMGFSFEESCELDTLGTFPLFQHGHSRRARNVSRGQLGGRAASIGEFSYVISSGKSSHTVRQTIVVFTEPLPAMPDFELSPENVLHKLGQVFGYQDIDFDSNEEFSKRYLLRGSDEEAIRRVFSPELQSLLASQPGWSVQTREGRVIVFRSGKSTDPTEIPSFAADALRIAGAFRTN